jgi:hypothetical protein
MRVTLGSWGLAGLMASACACSGAADRYPSLAQRPFETAPVAAPPVPNAPIRAGVSDGAIAAMVARASEAHGAFVTQQAEAERLAQAAAGQSLESNARARALVAMAGLASQRGATSAVLADLELLEAEAATSLAPAPALASARAQVAALLASEDARLALLWERMGS